MSGTLGNAAVTRARVQVPAWGRYWADVELQTVADYAVGAQLDLTIADVTMKVAVVSGGTFEGRSAYRLVGGAGKWGNTIKRKSYHNDATVKRSLILSDAAKDCGEQITDLPLDRLSAHYARPEGPASAVLHQIAYRNWYVDFAGVTHIGQRASTAYTGNAPRTHVDKALQTVELAVESIVGLVPGVVVDDFAPATDVEYVLDADRLTATVWAGPATTDRMVNAILSIVRAETAKYRYAGMYEFRVVTQAGERLNLQPVRSAMGFDDLVNVPVRPGVAGIRNDVALGELVLVAFVDMDPSRPVVVAHDAWDSPSFVPMTIDLGGDGALGVGRLGDTVQAGPFGGLITSASTRVKAVS